MDTPQKVRFVYNRNYVYIITDNNRFIMSIHIRDLLTKQITLLESGTTEEKQQVINDIIEIYNNRINILKSITF